MVFISYAREDIEVALRLYTDLSNRGIKAWLDIECILPGESWDNAIKTAIKKSEFFIALLSSHSVNKRGYVQKELRIALDILDEFPEGQIFLIPARVEPCTPSYEKLEKLNWVDLFPIYENGLSKIIPVLDKTTINTNDSHNPLPQQWFSHKYLSVNKKWEFTPNEDAQTLDGTQVCSREILNLNKELPHVDIYVSKSHGELYFDPTYKYHVDLLNFTRKSGSINILPPHKKSGSRFTFRVQFIPPLQQNEIAFFEYTFLLPRFKYARLSLLRQHMLNAVLSAKDYEFSSHSINNPIDLLNYELSFSKDCDISPIGFDVKRGHISFHEERDFIINNKFCSIDQDTDGSWHFCLTRKNPPVKTKYRFRWIPSRS